MNNLIVNPEFVYIPLGKYFTNSDLKVVLGSTVKVGDLLAVTEDGGKIYSSVSGKTDSIVKMFDNNNSQIRHIKIKNDGLDTKKIVKEINLGSNTAIKSRIRDYGIDKVEQKQLYTGLDLSLKPKNIVVDATSYNSGILDLNTFLLEDISSELLSKGVSAVGTMYGLKTVQVIVDKKTSKDIFTSENGVNINVTNLSDKKNADKYKKIESLLGKKLSDLLDSNEVVYIELSTVVDVINACILNEPSVHIKPVVVSGNGVKNQIAGYVKVGTRLAELSDKFGGYTEKKLHLISGNLIEGSLLRSDDMAIAGSVNQLFVRTVVDRAVEKCTQCGKCSDACPQEISPQSIIDAEIRKNDDIIRKYNVHDCIECGLCSTVCSSRINVREWMRRAKRRIK